MNKIVSNSTEVHYPASSIMIKLISLFFLLSLSAVNSYSVDNKYAIVDWNYGNGKVMYCGMGYMVGDNYALNNVTQNTEALKLFVNMVKQTSYVTNPKVGIFAVSNFNPSYNNTNAANALIAALATNGITGVLVTSDMIDTQAEIDNYDVLVLGGCGQTDGEQAAGYAGVQSVVQDFVQNNRGGVIFTGWAVYTLYRSGFNIFTEMFPLEISSNYSYEMSYSLNKYLPNDPLFSGVGTISIATYGEYARNSILKTGAIAYGNYSTYTPVVKSNQTITYPDIAPKTYGDATFTLGNATTDKGLTVTYTADNPTVVSIVGNQATILKAGSTKITATQAGDNNTFAATAVEHTLTVNKAALKIAAENKSKVYDGQIFGNFTVTYTGFVKNETATALTGTLAFVGTATTSVNAGLSYVIPGGLTSNNYDITFEAGTLEITKRPITITADAKSKIYGNADPVLTAQVTSGAIVIDNVASGSLTRIAGENVADYTISKGTYSYGSNYDETFVSNNFSINKRDVTVNAVSDTKAYDGTTASDKEPIVGTLATGDIINTAPTQVFDNANVGSTHVLTAKGLTIKNASNVDVTSNYLITYVASPATGVILGAPTITSTPVTTVGYNETYNYNVTATTEGSLVTTITARTLPAWLTLNTSGKTPVTIGSIPAGKNIRGVTQDNDGNIYAVTTESPTITIYKISSDGTTTIWRSGLFAGTVNSLLISDGYMYIPRENESTNSITRIPMNNPSATEELFASLTGGAFELAVKGDSIYASIINQSKIVSIDKSTKVAKTILTSSNNIPGFGPAGICFDQNGNLLIATYLGKSVLKYDGTTVTPILSNLGGEVTSVKQDMEGNYYVALNVGGLRKYKNDLSSYETVSLTEFDYIWMVSLNNAGEMSYTILETNLVHKIESKYTLKGTPTKSDLGAHTVVLRATNAAGYTEQAFTINVVDYVAPVVSTYSPEINATNIALQPTLSITFDEEVKLGTTGAFSIYNGTTLVKSYDLSVTADKALFTFSSDKKTVSITLPDNLPVNTLLSIGLDAGFVKDLYNNDFAGFTAASNTWRFTTMNKATQTITFPSITDKTYGDATFTLGDATTDKGLTVTYTADDPTVVSIVGNVATILKAGNTKITATQTGDDDTFAATAVEHTLTVNKAALKIAAENKSKVYDGQILGNFTVTYTGFVKNETATALTGTLAFGGTAATAVNSGSNYVITPGGLTSNNYNITFEAGNLEITKRPVTITADAKSKIYGNSDPTLTAQVTSGAIVTGDVASGLLTRVAGETVANYAINKGTYTFGSNYDETYVINSLSITKRPITITADAKSKVYGNADPVLTAQVTSGTIVTGDLASGSLTRADGENVANYAINKGTYTFGSNYDETYVINSLSITKRPITITADAKSKVYGNADPALTAQVTSGTIVTGDVVSGSLTRAEGENVANYAINKGTYTFGSNYDETYVINSLSITKRPITITADAKSKIYGNADPALTAQVTSGTIVTGDAVSGSLTRAEGENVADYAINKGTYTFGSNYDETFVGANLSIGKRAITITADAKSKVYGNADPTLTAHVTSGTIVTGDVVSGSLTRAVGENVADYTINKGTYTFGTNYDETFVGANLSISKRDVTVSAVSETKTYDGTTTSSVSPVVGTLATGDVVNVTPVQVFDNANSGSTHILTASGLTIKNASNENVTTNYNIIYETATGVVNAKQLFVTAPTLTTNKVYDGNANATVTAGSLTDVVTSDLANISVNTIASYSDANAGENKIITVIYTLSGSSASNYIVPVNDVYSGADVKITRKQLTISDPTVVTNKMVDGNTTAQITSVGILSGIESVDAGNISVAPIANYNNALVGKSKTITVVYTLGGSAKDNYSAPANFIINNAVISDFITLSPLTNPSRGCEGSDMNLDYNVLTGDPTTYKITFNQAALNAGMQNVTYTNLPTTGTSGTISFAIPSGVKEGTYSGKLVLNSDLGVESIEYPFEFIVNISNGMLVTKFNKVVLIDNSDNNFVSYQWFKDGVEIAGADKQFYNDPEGLSGVYSVKVTTTDGQTLYSCEKVLNIATPRKVTAYPNPLKDGQDCTVKIEGFDSKDFENADLQIFDIRGISIYKSTKVEKTNYINFEELSGVYVGQFTTADGAKYMFKILVEK